jgi:hypothetical protein
LRWPGVRSLEEDAADGRYEVNLNLGVMLGPRARPDLGAQAWEPVVAQERGHRELGRLDIASAVERRQQLDLGPLGVLPGGVDDTTNEDAPGVISGLHMKRPAGATSSQSVGTTRPVVSCSLLGKCHLGPGGSRVPSGGAGGADP